MNRVEAWNRDVAFNRMSRLTYQQIKELIIGEHIYYVNTNDEITGIIYDAKVIGKSSHIVTLECTPVSETLNYWGLVGSNTSHIESFSIIDALNEGSYQALFDNLVFKGDYY